MTQSVRQPEHFALHVDVAKRWWLRHLPHSAEAARFLHEKVALRAADFVAISGSDSDVLREIANDLGPDLTPLAASQIVDDVAALVEELQQEGILRLLPRQPRLRAAFLTSGLYHVSLDDSLAITVAEDSGAPLLIADSELYQRLKPLELRRPALRVVWLPNLLGP